MRGGHVLHAFTVTLFLFNFSPKCLEQGILALEHVNRKPIKNKEYLPIGYHFVSI